MALKSCEILIIEDNPNDAELMIRSLRKNHVANRLTVLKDGEEALNYINAKGPFKGRDINPRVIFLDLKLPKVDGLELLKILKTNKNTKKIPVIIVTSSAEEPDIEKAYDLGVNSYVIKPVNFQDFVEKMNQLGMYWMMVNEEPV